MQPRWAAACRPTISIMVFHNPRFLRVASVLLALLLWQAASMLVNQPIFLVSPTTVVARLIALLGDGAFYAALGFSFLRIALGFLGGLLLGTLAGAAAGRYRWVEILLFPYMVTVRSIPVASFAVVALLWFSSGTISAFVSFLIVLPIVYHAVQEGTRRIDPRMREMAAVFRFSPFDRFGCLWLPGVRPYLLSSARVSVGLAWKSGVAAELIGVPAGSLGQLLYLSKIYMSTADLFAVTLMIVLATVVCEKLSMGGLRILLGERRVRV